MSEPLSSFERFIQQYPNANFNIVVKLKKLTQAEIAKHTGKKQKKQRKYKPAKKLRMKKNITQEKDEKSILPVKLIPNEVIEKAVQDKEMENNETRQKEEKSILSDEHILSEIIEQTFEKKGMESNETKQNEEMSIQPYELIPSMLIKQEIQNDSDMMDNETQSMDIMPNLSNDFFPNLVIKQEVEDEDDGYVDNYNVEQDNDNMFDPSNVFIPNIFDQEMQNDNMENYMPITAQENMFGLSNNFTPNFICGQELNGIHMGNFIPQDNLFDPSNNIIPCMTNSQAIQNNDNVGINIPQVNHNMSGSSNGFRPLIIKEENRNYDFVDEYVAQDDMFVASNNLIFNTINGQGIQNNDNVGINIPKVNENTPSSSNGNVPNISIKQEILDDGNIEINTDVLKPSADQEYEDETPW